MLRPTKWFSYTPTVRAEQIKERLDLIASGRALDILKATDERERERKTFCVGVRWYYETEDLVEIVQVC